MKLLILGFALVSLQSLAFGSDSEMDFSIEAEQVVLDAEADAAAARDAKVLAARAQEELKEAKKTALQNEQEAKAQSFVAKRELATAEAVHHKTQAEIKKWRAEAQAWKKKQAKAEEQIAQARSRQQVAEENAMAAQQLAAEARESAERVMRERERALKAERLAQRKLAFQKRQLSQAKETLTALPPRQVKKRVPGSVAKAR